jgi:hypothetical protein
MLIAATIVRIAERRDNSNRALNLTIDHPISFKYFETQRVCSDIFDEVDKFLS